jgi:hypothetical protein
LGLNKLASPVIIGALLILSTLTTLQSNVLAQENGLPKLLVRGSSDTAAYEVPLKGIRQNGETTKVSNYKIDFNNVIQIGQGQNLVLFPDSSAQGFTITKAKLVNEQKQSINLISVSGQQNAFSLNGIPNGVYTLQVVGRLGNTEGGYETVLVIPIVTEETRKIVQDRINQILLVEIYVEIIFEEPGPSPCYFDPSLEECKPIGGRCPDGFGFNDDEQCIPHGECPNGYGRLDDDETGTCYKKSDIKTCPDGYITHKNQECPPEYQPIADPPICDENTPPGTTCRDEGDPDDCEPGYVDRGFGCEPEDVQGIVGPVEGPVEEPGEEITNPEEITDEDDAPPPTDEEDESDEEGDGGGGSEDSGGDEGDSSAESSSDEEG